MSLFLLKFTDCINVQELKSGTEEYVELISSNGSPLLRLDSSLTESKVTGVQLPRNKKKSWIGYLDYSQPAINMENITLSTIMITKNANNSKHEDIIDLLHNIEEGEDGRKGINKANFL